MKNILNILLEILNIAFKISVVGLFIIAFVMMILGIVYTISNLKKPKDMENIPIFQTMKEAEPAGENETNSADDFEKMDDF